ncbi:MAG: nitroreductase [archaeon]|nr:nitroreductase [archaeon]
MNDVLDAMVNRRSCRKYTDEVPEDSLIDQIMEAGLYAASGRNEQAAIMIAITDKAIRDEFSKENAKYIPGSPDTDPFYGAPVVIAVLGRKDWPTHVYDGSLVIGNLMLAAHTVGLGSCWIHRAKEVFESEFGMNKLKELGITKEYEGIGFCVLGYPADDIPFPPERKDNRIYYLD